MRYESPGIDANGVSGGGGQGLFNFSYDADETVSDWVDIVAVAPSSSGSERRAVLLGLWILFFFLLSLTLRPISSPRTHTRFFVLIWFSFRFLYLSLSITAMGTFSSACMFNFNALSSSS